MQPNRTIYHVYLEHPSHGEMDWFFDANHLPIHYWYHNDAQFRDEYMTPLFDALNIKIISIPFTASSHPVVKALRQELKKLLS